MEIRRTTGRTPVFSNFKIALIGDMISTFSADSPPILHWKNGAAARCYLSPPKRNPGTAFPCSAHASARLTRRHQGSGIPHVHRRGSLRSSCPAIPQLPPQFFFLKKKIHHRFWGPAPPPLSPGCLTITTKRFQAGARPHRQPDALN